MEIVDVINEQNQVLYQISKEEAHQKGLLHRTIIAEVHNSKGEWMLVKQADHKQDAGQYVSPVGGHIQGGESEVDALKRETEEELGITDIIYKREGQFIYNRKVRDRHENHLFIVYVIHSEATPILNDESVDYAYFSEEDLKKKLQTAPKQFGDAFYAVVNALYPHLL